MFHVPAFWQRFFFRTLLNLNVHPGVTMYHTLVIIFTINAKEWRPPHATCNISNLYIETEYPILTLQKNNFNNFEQGCIQIHIYTYAYRLVPIRHIFVIYKKTWKQEFGIWSMDTSLKTTECHAILILGFVSQGSFKGRQYILIPYCLSKIRAVAFGIEYQ